MGSFNMSKKQKEFNKLPFLQVDEGFKKNQASERLRIYLGVKMSERSEIEMRYIKLLQDWTNDLNPPMDANDGSECYMDSEVVKRVMKALKTEGEQLIEERQRVYNNIMAEDGPYSRFQTPIVSCKDSHKTYFEMKEEFSVLKAKRKALEKELKTNKEVMEHMVHKIEDIESRLSNRSRLTSSRRPSARGGTRKVDDMRNRLSTLRRQKETLVDKNAELEKNILEMESSTEGCLAELEEQLQGLEDTRIGVIVSQTKQFLDYVDQKSVKQRSPGTGNFLSRHPGLENIEGLLKVHWTDVRINAKRSEMGEQFKLRELFSVAGQKSSKSGLITNPSGSKPSTSANMFERNPSRQMDVILPSGDSQTSLSSNVHSPSESMTSLEIMNNTNIKEAANDFSDADSIDHTRPPTRRAKPSTDNSHVSIESVDLPPEVLCPAEMTRIDPNKQYLSSYRHSKMSADVDQGVHLTEYSQVSRFTGRDANAEDANDVTKLRDVQVIALQDNLVPASSNELSFVKGQVIKQKTGRNEDGYCYGWTKEHRLAKKEYGFYKQSMVQLCTPKSKL